MPRNDRFLNACKGEPVDRMPVWLMRQAGRYMPEYRAIRERHSFLEMIGSPELATEITLQPVQSFDLDAAIIFSDILPTLGELGFEIEYVDRVGPVIGNPVQSPEDIGRLRAPGNRSQAHATCEAIRLTCTALDETIPLIGFAGAPFTLAAYAIEGGSSRNFLATKQFLREHPKPFHDLLGRVAEAVSDSLLGQIEAGASAVQLFDSWAGVLGPADFAEFALPYARRIMDSLQQAGAPLIYFSTGTGGLLPKLRDTGAGIIGIDWRVSIAHARSMLGSDITIQGNLDPTVLLSSESELKRQAGIILDEMNASPRHIFNLGHGVLKETPVDHVRALVDFVHSYEPGKTP
jgi:uroporphyrinogen decarboxylase